MRPGIHPGLLLLCLCPILCWGQSLLPPPASIVENSQGALETSDGLPEPPTSSPPSTPTFGQGFTEAQCLASYQQEAVTVTPNFTTFYQSNPVDICASGVIGSIPGVPGQFQMIIWRFPAINFTDRNVTVSACGSSPATGSSAPDVMVIVVATKGCSYRSQDIVGYTGDFSCNAKPLQFMVAPNQDYVIWVSSFSGQDCFQPRLNVSSQDVVLESFMSPPAAPSDVHDSPCFNCSLHPRTIVLESSQNTGAIVGGVVGGVALVALLVLAIVWWCHWRHKPYLHPPPPTSSSKSDIQSHCTLHLSADGSRELPSKTSTKHASEGGTSLVPSMGRGTSGQQGSGPWPGTPPFAGSARQPVINDGSRPTPFETDENGERVVLPPWRVVSTPTEDATGTAWGGAVTLSMGLSEPGPTGGTWTMAAKSSTGGGTGTSDPLSGTSEQQSQMQSSTQENPSRGTTRAGSDPAATRIVVSPAQSAQLNEMWEIDHSHLVQGERIGKGSYGEVFKGEWRGTPVAIKKLLKDLEDLSARQLEDLVNELKHEAAILSRLRHPNVLLFMGTVIASTQLSIVTAYMPRGSLFRLLGRRDIVIEPRRRLALARDIARGMHYLHSCEPMVVHRDLKSPNLLVDHDWSIKIADFGMSSLKCATFLTHRSSIGTVEWMAPEVLRNERCTEKCDVYSYAVILYELVTNERPWADCSPWQVMSLVGSQTQRLPIPDDIQPEAARLIQQCWAEDPTARPSFGDVLARLRELKELKPSPSRMEVHHGTSPRSG